MTHRAIYVPRIEASVFIAMLKLRYVTNSSLNSTTRSIIRHPYFNQFTDKVRERERERERRNTRKKRSGRCTRIYRSFVLLQGGLWNDVHKVEAVQIAACIGPLLRSLSKEVATRSPFRTPVYTGATRSRADIERIQRGESPIFSLSLEIVRNAQTQGLEFFVGTLAIFVKIYATHLLSRICQDESRYAGRPCIFQGTRLCAKRWS